jgi:hypothetical protein
VFYSFTSFSFNKLPKSKLHGNQNEYKPDHYYIHASGMNDIPEISEYLQFLELYIIHIQRIMYNIYKTLFV